MSITPEKSERDPFEQLAESFLSRYRAGERPSVQEYADRYPELAEQIRALFPALVLMEEHRPGKEEPVGGTSRVLDLSKIPKQLGEYRILREVRRGGMGVVYEAVQETLGRHVALKVLPFSPFANPTHLERFRREARAAARLHHTHIVPVFGVGECEGIHFFAMQFIHGQGLDDVLAEVRRLRRQQDPTLPGGGQPGESLAFSVAESLLTGRFSSLSSWRKDRDSTNREDGGLKIEDRKVSSSSDHSRTGKSAVSTPSPSGSHSDLTCQTESKYFRSVAQIGLQVAEALAYAHSQGVLHRDIKPSNLLLDLAGQVWITDFGLAKTEESDELTRTGDMVGTLRYMAPERLSGQADPRSDVYGLGITLYEMLTLRPAFADSARHEVIKKVVEEEPPAPHRLDRKIPRDLETVVLKAIAKEPEQRYQSAAEFAADLKRFAEDKPIRARRVSQAERLWRWSRRNPALAWLTGSVAASLLAVAIISTFSAIWLKGKSDQLAEAERQARLREAEALLGQAHGIRLSRRPGQRFEALKALGKVAAIGRELEQPPDWFDQPRNEAIAALALPDIHITHEWEEDSETTWVEMNDDFSLHVCADDKGQCTIHRLPDAHSGVSGPHTPVWRLPSFDEPLAVHFGAGRTLAVHGQSSGRFQLWDFADGEPVLRFEENGIFQAVDTCWFRPDGRLIALSHADGSISVRDTATGERTYQLKSGKIIKGQPILHPSEPFVAIFSYNHPEFQVVDLRTGAIIAAPLPPWPRGNSFGVWSPDGRTLTVPSGDAEKIQQYAFDPSAPALKPTQLLDNPASGCPAIVYNRAGDRFASRGWNAKVALFDAISGRVLFTTPAFPPASPLLRFDPTGKRLAAARTGDRKQRVGLWSVADAHEYRALFLAEGAEGYSERLPAIHPDGRLAAMAQRGGVALFDLESGRKLAEVPAPSVNDQNHPSLAFDGAGNLLTNSMSGAFRWPVRMDTANPGRIVVGPPERLPLKPGRQAIAASRDGQVIAQCMWFGYGMEGGGWILHPNSPVPHKVNAGASMRACGVTPDGRWVAFAGGKGEVHIKVYEADTLKCVFQRPSKYVSYARFTSDGRWLVTGIDGGQVYEVGTWAPGPKLGPGTPWSATKDVVVMVQPNGIYRLVELATGRELARLEDPEQNSGAAVFTPDGSKLVVTAKDGLRVWVLRRIRQELGQLGLDWDGPPYWDRESNVGDQESGNEERRHNDRPSPLKDRQVGKPELRIEIDLGKVVMDPPPAGEELPVAGSLHHRLTLYSLAIAVAPLPFHPEPFRQRGHVYQQLGQPQQAIEDFSAALIRQPPNPELQAHLYTFRGKNYWDLKDYERAIADFEKSLEIDPRSREAAWVCIDLAWIYVTGPEKLRNPKKALVLAKKAVASKPTQWDFLTTLGVAYYRLGHYSEAVETLKSSLSRNDGQADAFDLFFLAMCHARLGHTAEARGCYDRAVKWIHEQRHPLSPDWVEQLTKFRAEADAVLGRP
jgi:serine/threonine protein kinase/WD40 repeat protein/Tfp pilus assembly protein PilF